MRLADAKDDQTEYGEEIKGVTSDTVEGHQGAELAHDDIDGCQGGVESHGINRGVSKSGLITKNARKRLAGPGASAKTTAR